MRLTPAPARPHTGGPGRRAPARAVGKRPPAHPVQLLTAAGQKPPPDSRERGGRGPRRPAAGRPLRPVPPSTSTLGARGAAPLRRGRSPAPLAPLASPDTPSPCLAAAGAESRRAPVCDRVARSRRDGGRGARSAPRFQSVRDHGKVSEAQNRDGQTARTCRVTWMLSFQLIPC